MGSVEVRGLWDGFRPKTRMGWRRPETRWALRDVNFDVSPGELLAIVGHNGSGKSTLLQCLAGVYRPQRGTVRVSAPTASLVELSAGLSRELTGRENLLIASSLIGMSRAQLEERFDAIVAFAGLDLEVLDAPLRTYSAGMGLRLGFAVSVHVDPEVLLVDEVMAVGDESFQRRCLERVADLRADGCAVVLVSHDLGLVERVADRVGVLHRGELVHLGSPADVVPQYRTEMADASSPTPRGALWREPGRRRRRR